MENLTPQTCQTCFQSIAEAGSQPQTQWISVCRCERTYATKSEFSIDVCAGCHKRIVDAVPGGGTHKDLCSCVKPQPEKVPAYMKQGESDSIVLDLASIGLAPETFPLERYTPLALLGDGARATVVLARDKQRGTKVAVKCFKRIGPHNIPTFEKEVRKNKQLSHTNIAKIVDSGVQNGKTPFLVTEYKDGFNLEQYLAVYGIPSHDVAVKVLLGVCEALLYAQKQGVLHGAIRPGNIIFIDDKNSEPSVCVLDFALPEIKAGEELTEIADALYISADEARNLPPDEKSEVYSLGCVGFAMLTGRPPFQSDSAREIKNSHALKLPPRISDLKFESGRPRDLEEVIEKCLEKDPRERFESVARFSERLEVFPRRKKMQIASVLAARQKQKLMKILMVALAVVALCALVFFVFLKH